MLYWNFSKNWLWALAQGANWAWALSQELRVDFKLRNKLVISFIFLKLHHNKLAVIEIPQAMEILYLKNNKKGLYILYTGHTGQW